MNLPRLIHDPAEVDEILKDRAWGMSMPALAPLLGDGVIMATGSNHTALRRQIGGMMPPDLRPVGLITQRLRRVVGTLIKREDVS